MYIYIYVYCKLYVFFAKIIMSIIGFIARTLDFYPRFYLWLLELRETFSPKGAQ